MINLRQLFKPSRPEFPHAVILLPGAEGVSQDHPEEREYEMSPYCWRWMLDQGWTWLEDWYDEPVTLLDDQVCVRVWFRDPRQATMFKLRWAGHV